MLHFFSTGGHFGLAAAIENKSLAGAEAKSGADRVQCRVSAADDGYVFPGEIDHGFVVEGKFVRVHEIDAREEFVGGVDAIEVLARNSHELRQTGAGANEDSVKAFFLHQFVNSDGASDYHVGLEFHTHGAHVIDLLANDLLGEAELGNTVNQHSADFVQGFEDVDPVALLDEVAGDREAGGAAADDGHFLAGRRSFLNFVEVEMLLFVVGDEALEVTDAEGLNLFSHQAAALAMIFLRADASGDGGEHVVFPNLGGGAEEVPGHDQLHEVSDLHAHGAPFGASRLGAFEAAQRFLTGEFGRVAQIDFGEVGGAQLRELLGHVLPRNFHPLFERQRIQGGSLDGRRHRWPPWAQTSARGSCEA